MPHSGSYGYWTITRLEERVPKRPTHVINPYVQGNKRTYAVFVCPWGCGKSFTAPVERATQIRSILARDHAVSCKAYRGHRPNKPNRCHRVTYASLDELGPIDQLRPARASPTTESAAPWLWQGPAPLPPGQGTLPALFLKLAPKGVEATEGATRDGV